MRSDLAARIDRGGQLAETASTSALVSSVEIEYDAHDYGSTRYTPNELYWMGYVYRAWCFAYGQTSKRVYALAGARKMRALYYPYHTLDPLDAVDRIREAAGIYDSDYTEQGVEILRRIRNERGF